jgi:hypothetical protein
MSEQPWRDADFIVAGAEFDLAGVGGQIQAHGR